MTGAEEISRNNWSSIVVVSLYFLKFLSSSFLIVNFWTSAANVRIRSSMGINNAPQLHYYYYYYLYRSYNDIYIFHLIVDFLFLFYVICCVYLSKALRALVLYSLPLSLWHLKWALTDGPAARRDSSPA